MDFWEWLQSVLGRPSTSSGAPRGAAQDPPVAPLRQSWNERQTSQMVRTPPMGLAGAIETVLGRHSRELRLIGPGSSYEEPVVMEDLIVNGGPSLTEEQRLMDSLGYLPRQRHPDWDEENARRIFNSTSPYGHGYYSDPQDNVREAIDRLTTRGRGPARTPSEDLAASEDAWALYLGLPQPFKNWQVSPYKPTQSNDSNTVYLRSPGIWNDLLTGDLRRTEEFGVDRVPASPPDGTVRRILETIGPGGRAVISGGFLMDHEGHGPNGERLTSTVPFALADFTVSVGADEKGPYISIYDIWDLDKIPGADKVGKPFEIYDRLYFDPATLQPIWESQNSNRR